MKHVVMSGSLEGLPWTWDVGGFYRFHLEFGANLHDTKVLHVVGVKPSPVYLATVGRKLMYRGGDRNEAVKAGGPKETAEGYSRGVCLEELAPELPAGQFIIDGEDRVVSGTGLPDACLLFAGEKGRLRGEVEIDQATTATVILECAAGRSSSGSAIAVAAVFKLGQQLVFHVTGRKTDFFAVYTFDGEKVERISYEAVEWGR